jgi:hypothetical protein
MSIGAADTQSEIFTTRIPVGTVFKQYDTFG